MCMYMFQGIWDKYIDNQEKGHRKITGKIIIKIKIRQET